MKNLGDMEIEKKIQESLGLIDRDYSNVTLTSQLWTLFAHKEEGMERYIKQGRHFYHWTPEKGYRLIVVTYVRSGVMFFKYKDDESRIEYAWFIGSFNSGCLYAAEIYVYEIGRILSEYIENADKDFPEMCKQCKWFDANGQMKIKVID